MSNIAPPPAAPGWSPWRLLFGLLGIRRRLRRYLLAGLERRRRPAPPPPRGLGERLWGWAAIAAHLGVSTPTAQTWAALRVDPLPVRRRRGTTLRWAWSGYLDDWQDRRRGIGERLEGWEAICARLEGRDPTTARRLARDADDPLPVQGVGTGRPWAFATAIRDWVHRADEPLRAARSAPAAPARAEVDATDGRQRREVGIAVIDDQARALLM
ncbi:hypothetical protein WME76_46620 (plasmid) [Sorangium sp. So ce119]|uniref:hypothetical protein n=1 Tax=Sorangium sp. So ce119 TaxID=3133279 RepID=UPI003F5FDF27